MQDLGDIDTFILWQIEVMCSHHHTYTQQKGKCCMFWAQADRRLSQRMRVRLRGGLTATPITTPFWMIGSGSSAPQPSAKTQPFLCVTPISCTHMMRDGGVCHHLYHSTQMKPQPWWIQGLSYPTALYGETNELFFLLRCKQKILPSANLMRLSVSFTKRTAIWGQTTHWLNVNPHTSQPNKPTNQSTKRQTNQPTNQQTNTVRIKNIKSKNAGL